MEIVINTRNENISYNIDEKKNGKVKEYHLSFFSEKPIVYDKIKIQYELPLNDIHAYWTPGQFGDRSLHMLWNDWGGFESKSTTYAPMGCLTNTRNENKLCVALSDAVNAHQFAIGISEENKTAMGKIFLFTEKTNPRKTYDVVLRFDMRDVKFYEAIKDISKWYENFYPPLDVPEYCNRSMYSTWYSFHQDFTAEKIEYECEKFRDYGFASVIVDDGWQTDDTNRGYAYCGDWETALTRIPDFRSHVEKIHGFDMKYLLWFAVPFIGYNSKVYEGFADKMLYKIDELKTGVVDIRYKEVRDYLTETYVNSVKEKNLDGLKLDFVDSFTLNQRKTNTDFKHDISLQESFVMLFNQIVTELKAINNEIMIEFRQNYIGPAMRQFGNIFRAADCPGNVIQNRIRTTDLRLLSGNTAVHSDMIMWSAEDTVESAALQIINILYSVPQVSVKYDEITDEHRKMLKHWIKFWKENRDVLLSQDFRAFYPQNNYLKLESRFEDKVITTIYSNQVIKLDENVKKQIVVNGCMDETHIINNMLGIAEVEVFDTLGNKIDNTKLVEGISEVIIPKSGYIQIVR